MSAFLDVDEQTITVTVTPRLPAAAVAMLAEAAEQEEGARLALVAAGAKRRLAIATLKSRGMTQRDMARALGLSPQRVSQLAKGRA